MLLSIISSLLAIAGFLSWINHKIFRWPHTTGVLIMSSILSIMLFVFGSVMPVISVWTQNWVKQLNFEDVFLHGMLSILLFAGALHINVDDLKSQKLAITMLSSLSVVVSMGVTAVFLWGAALVMGHYVSFMVCLLFGALIAPTDPISAMENLKESDLPKMLQNKIAGESLFNDGVGVVVFIMMTNVVYHGESLYWGKALLDIVWAIGIGSLIGVSMGWMVTRLLRDIEEPAIEMILTLAVATGSYALAEHLNASAPMATVWAGLIIGNMGKTSVLSSTAQRRVHLFWNMLDDLLTTILFVLMGFVLLILKVDIRVSLIAVAAIPVVLIARWFSVWIPISILRKFYPMSRKSVRILTWAGLRGGISLALALSLPEGTTRDLLLVCAWAVVVFSILVQGTTLKRMVESNITVFKEV